MYHCIVILERKKPDRQIPGYEDDEVDILAGGFLFGVNHLNCIQYFNFYFKNYY